MSHIQAKFQTSASSHGRQRVSAPKPKKPSAPAKLPHITKQMSLAIRLEHLLSSGQVKDQAEIARAAGITRARVTQILNLTNLAPDIQHASSISNVPSSRVLKQLMNWKAPRTSIVAPGTGFPLASSSLPRTVNAPFGYVSDANQSDFDCSTSDWLQIVACQHK